MVKNSILLQNLDVEQLTTLMGDVFDAKITAFQKQVSTPTTEVLYTIQQASEFLNLSVPTIYSKVSKGELPVMKKGKKLYFSSIELMQFIKDGRRKTNLEIEAEAVKYLKK